MLVQYIYIHIYECCSYISRESLDCIFLCLEVERIFCRQQVSFSLKNVKLLKFIENQSGPQSICNYLKNVELLPFIRYERDF